MATHKGHYQRVAATTAPQGVGLHAGAYAERPVQRTPARPVQGPLGLSFPTGLMRSNITFLVDMGDQGGRTYTGAFIVGTQWVSMAQTRCWAAIVSGTEFFSLLQAGHRVDARFKMRWLEFPVVNAEGATLEVTTPTTAMRIMWNGNLYLIKSVDDPDDMHIELQIDGEMAGKETDIL